MQMLRSFSTRTRSRRGGYERVRMIQLSALLLEPS
uniref:Uncharacterized protein n=1 Tax=Brassica campestris TaxID=3711 RepID=A0A3P6BSF0_BRACM|nr:unnamed protein product [Brassica rapa]